MKKNGKESRLKLRFAQISPSPPKLSTQHIKKWFIGSWKDTMNFIWNKYEGVKIKNQKTPHPFTNIMIFAHF